MHRLEEAIWHVGEEGAYASHFLEGEWHHNDDCREENDELKYVGDHHSAEAAYAYIYHAEDAKGKNGGGEGYACRHFHDFCYGVEEAAGGEYGYYKEYIGVELLYAYSQSLTDIRCRRECVGALPAWRYPCSHHKAGDRHCELDYHGHYAVGVGYRTPHHEGAGRKEAHEKREAVHAPGNVAASGEEALHILARA